MKIRLLIFFLLFSVAKLFSQDSLPVLDSAYGLKIQRYVKGLPSEKQKPYYISVGQKIRIRTNSDHHQKEGILTAFTDSSLVMDSSTVFMFSDIWQISWYDKRVQNYGAGVILAGGAIMVTGLGILFSPLYREDASQIRLESVIFALVFGPPTFIGGLALAGMGIGLSEKGKWQKRELSTYWRISVSHLPVKTKTEKKQRR